MAETIRIDRRFRGPPESGNGGYVCGMLAERIGTTAEVRLRAPPPIDHDLSLEWNEDGSLSLLDDGIMVASAQPAELEIDTPPAPSLVAADEGSQHYSGFDHHWFPSCFVCGPERKPGDGLRIFAGAIPGQEVVLSPWTPDASLDDGSGYVAHRYLWAALDCPGAFAAFERTGDPLVLGTLTARIDRPVPIGTNTVVAGWLMGVDGRKHFCGTAIYDESGAICARASAVWIRIDAPA